MWVRAALADPRFGNMDTGTWTVLHVLGCHVYGIVGAVSIVEPMLTWLDLTATDRDEMRRVLALFKEGTVDELGLGTLRDAFAATLFPGVTSIQTRLRYVLFVPWIYRRLEDNGTRSEEVGTKARKAEVALIDALAESDDWGVIGIQARNDLQRLPSSVYWRCCVTWGIFMPGKGQSWYHNHFDGLRDAARSVSRTPNRRPRVPPSLQGIRQHSPVSGCRRSRPREDAGRPWHYRQDH